ncbi:MAG: N-acetylneuraminate [Geobacteraceae bacterium]|nr:MAG: N-acetylneuraminate [Geobacteraceae bacterium]
MGNGFDFKDLFIFDLANNHQGDVKHGLRIIREVGDVVAKHAVRGAIKFQFRQLDSFIHPGHKTGSDNKHIPRFLSTKLSRKEFETLTAEVKKSFLISMCTPFDEESVDLIIDMGIDVIKIASCSAKDWPLLEKVAETGKPVIFSTGGLLLKDIDNLVSFFDHRGVDYAIMHCVSIYPIPDDLFHLNQIDLLRNRYPSRCIGWSTHEDPNEMSAVQIAVAKGAKLFERHVGINTDKITLNAYSATPEQLDSWISAYKKAKTLCGSLQRPESTAQEIESINSLNRGVYAKKRIKAGTPISRDLVYFAMPYAEGQLISGHWQDGITAKETIEADAAILLSAIECPLPPARLVIQQAIHEVKALLNEAKVPLNSEFTIEYSHHYGMENFRETGAVLIDCINRSYCKKVIVQLPNQKHPSHFHKRKEETFQVLYGILLVEIDGHNRIMYPGETLVVLPGVWHNFRTETGVVFEEISTTHFNDDSVYQDKSINKMARHERKTSVDHWGRFQLVSNE